MPVDAAKRQAFQEYLVANKEWETKVFTGKMQGIADGPARIPFVTPMLTWATGGGIPVGHMCRWYGVEGSGKSLTNLGIMYVAQNYPRIITEYLEAEIHFWERRNKFKAVGIKQRLKRSLERFPDGMGICLYDTEQRFEFKFAEQMGINIRDDSLLVVDENIIENIIYQMADAVDAYHIIIVDSVSNAESVQEAALVPGKYEQGTAAAAWKRLRSVRRRLDRQENTIIFVDQVRNQLGSTTFQGGKQVPEVSPPKIRFLKHNVSVALAYGEGKKLYLDSNGVLTDDYKKASDDYKALGSKGKQVAGLEMRCKVDKNSTAAPFRNAAMRFRFPVVDTRSGELIQDVGFDEPFEMLEIAEHFHIVEMSGGRFYPLDENFKHIPKPGKGKGDISWHGAPAARAAIMEDEEMIERIRTKLQLAS